MGGPGDWWRRKSTPAKVETYTRWSFHFFAPVEVAAIGLPAFGQVRASFVSWMTAMVVAHASLCAMTASRALDWKRGRRGQPVRLLWVLGVATYAVAVAALVIQEYGPRGDAVDTAAGTVFGGVLSFGSGTMALGVRGPRRVLALVAGFAAGAASVSFALGVPGPTALVTAVMVLAGGGFIAFTAMLSV